ncbi:hypothetical protein H1P_860001 [Hyella patelloides LEGE 07179]|uniref:Uncharacterized protein n=1 Tax=Hyella patelloides LEGE 07179 TaxID=945734 RepID=A0A563W4S6_9CYAN|nr:hypothetical protein [Hyella patelloides]VEP18675.1 hypothetical protein H1P_860001 [Hyella patelloides LEGE 07179]
MTKIKLTPEEEALIPSYVEKWRNIAFSTRQITQQEAEEVIGFLYAVLGYKKPSIIFETNLIKAIVSLFGEHYGIFERVNPIIEFADGYQIWHK